MIALPDTPAEPTALEKYLDTLKELKRRKDENKLADYKPYPRQIDFHAAGAKFRERLFMAGNQCVSPWTFIETDHTTALSATHFSAKDGHVLSWSGESQCVAQSSSGVLRGIEPAFRVVLDTGRFFDCSSNHQILTESGWISLDLLVSLSSGLRCNHRLEDYQASCVEYGYLCDPRLPLEANSAPAQLLQQVGVHSRSLSLSLEDAEERILQHTSVSQECDRLSTADDGVLSHAALFGMFAAPAYDTDVLRLQHAHQEKRQLALALGAELQSVHALGLDDEAKTDRLLSLALSRDAACKLEQLSLSDLDALQSLDVHSLGHSLKELFRDAEHTAILWTYSSPKLVGGSEIISIVPIGFQPIIDIRVNTTDNYKAAGVYHHNCGKTWSSAYEIAYHLTGQYPDDWKGRRWTRPVTGWASGVTSESLRDTLQRLVMGRPEEWGTGTIPKNCIIKVSRAMGIADAIDTVHIKHVSGGISRLAFKSYEKGREKWQGETVDFVAYDEEPPLDIYIEGLTRTNATGGMVWMTFTPLLGMSKVVKRFLQEHNDDRNITRMTINDVGHYTEEERNRIVSSYPEHEREARAAGKPVLGDGAVFPIAESSIKVPAFHLPDIWPRICAIDFGWAHKTAINWLAWDRDTDTVYVYDVVAVSKQTPTQIAPMIKQRGEWIPCAWPHDGLQTEKGSGIQLAEQYRTAGVNMLYEMAQLPETGVEGEQKVSRTSVEAGISLMLQAMQQGRFKVFDHLNDWFDEFGNYHRKDGKIVAEGDDIMSSCRYAFVSLRHAITPPDPTAHLELKRDYDWRV